MRESKKNIILSVATMISIGIGLLVRKSSKGILFDTFIMEFIHKDITLRGTFIMKLISLLGSKYFFLIGGSIIFMYFVNKMEKRNARLVVFSIAGSFLANIILKYIFARIRPENYMLIEQAGFSFPSGHTMVSTCFFSMMTYIILEKVTDKKSKIALIVGNIILIALIGFSRIYLGVHWPTDVLVGYLMGYIVFELIKTMAY